MQPKGYVLINREFAATRLWPGMQLTKHGWIDLEREYKQALAGTMALVMDIAVDGAYLVMGESKAVGQFLWTIEAADTKEGSFLPVIKKYGTLIPVGLTPLQEMQFLAKHLANIAR